MKQLILSFIIVIFSYYPVYAERLSREENEKIIANGEIIEYDVQSVYVQSAYPTMWLWVRHKNKVYYCELQHNIKSSYLEPHCDDTTP